MRPVCPALIISWLPFETRFCQKISFSVRECSVGVSLEQTAKTTRKNRYATHALGIFSSAKWLIILIHVAKALTLLTFCFNAF